MTKRFRASSSHFANPTAALKYMGLRCVPNMPPAPSPTTCYVWQGATTLGRPIATNLQKFGDTRFAQVAYFVFAQFHALPADTALRRTPACGDVRCINPHHYMPYARKMRSSAPASTPASTPPPPTAPPSLHEAREADIDETIELLISLVEQRGMTSLGQGTKHIEKHSPALAHLIPIALEREPLPELTR